MTDSPSLLAMPSGVFSRRRRRRSREYPTGNPNSNLNMQLLHEQLYQHLPRQHYRRPQIQRVPEEAVEGLAPPPTPTSPSLAGFPVAEETPASIAPVLTPSRFPALVSFVESHPSTSSTSSSHTSNSSKESVVDCIERESTADSDPCGQSVAFLPAVEVPKTEETTPEEKAEARTSPAAPTELPASEGKVAARCSSVVWFWGLTRRVLFPTRLQGAVLLLLVLQQLLLMGLLVQRQQLQQQGDMAQQHALSLEQLYRQQQQRLLKSRRARLGFSLPEGEQKPESEQQRCKCKPCAKLPQPESLVDISDRFKHTNKDIEMTVGALLETLDGAATSIKEAYEASSDSHWKRRFEEKLSEFDEF